MIRQRLFLLAVMLLALVGWWPYSVWATDSCWWGWPKDPTCAPVGAQCPTLVWRDGTAVLTLASCAMTGRNACTRNGTVWNCTALACLSSEPQTWRPGGEIWSGVKPSRDPCDDVIIGTQDCSLETRVQAVLGKGCNLPELLAASKEYDRAITSSRYHALVMGVYSHFVEGDRSKAEERWRQALRACTP